MAGNRGKGDVLRRLRGQHCKNTQDFVILETPPVEIIQLLFRDSSGSVCTRLCSNPAALTAGIMVLSTIKLIFWTIWTTPSILFISLSAGISNILLTYDGEVIPKALLDEYEVKFLDQNKGVKWLLINGSTCAAIGGALFGTLANDYLGRRRTILLSDITLIFGLLLSASSIDHHVLIGGRLVYGIGIGAISMSMPLYVAEFSPPSIRGFLIGLNGFLGGSGQMLSSFFIEFFSKFPGTWRWTVALGIIFPLLQFFLIKSLPDTPLWVLRQGMGRETMNNVRDSLVYIYPPDQVKDILQKLVASANESNIRENYFLKVRNAWGDWEVRKKIFGGVFVQAAPHVIGLGATLRFSPYILQFGGYEAQSIPASLSKITTAIVIMSGIVNLVLVEFIGRKKIIITSLKLMSSSLLVLSPVYYALSNTGPQSDISERTQVFSANNTCWALDCAACIHEQCGFCTLSGKVGVCLEDEIFCQASKGLWFDLNCPSKYGFVAIGLLYAIIFIYGFGLSSTPSTITAELYPARYRGLGGGIATVTMWVAHLMFAKAFSTLMDYFDTWTVFGIQALLSAFILCPIMKLVPATQGRNLEDIEEREGLETTHSPRS